MIRRSPFRGRADAVRVEDTPRERPRCWEAMPEQHDRVKELGK
jgi:hypothetical protein